MKNILLISAWVLLGVTFVQAQSVWQDNRELPLTPARKSHVPFLGFTINIPLQKAINNDKVRSRNKAKKLVTKFETQEQIILGRNVVNISLPINKDFYNTKSELISRIFVP